MILLLNNYHNSLLTSSLLLLSLVLLNNLFIQCDLLLNDEAHPHNNNRRDQDMIINNNNKELFQHVDKSTNMENHAYQRLRADKYRSKSITNESTNQTGFLSKTTTEINHDKSLPVTLIKNNNVSDYKLPITNIVPNKSSLYKYSLNQDVSNKKLINNKKLSSSKYLSSWAFSLPSTQIKSTTKIVENWPLSDHRIEFIEDLIQKNIGIKFRDDDGNNNNFSQMIIIPKTSSIYLVKNRTNEKIDINHHLSNFKKGVHWSTAKEDEMLLWSCHSMKEISLLAKMPDERMIWICYVTHHSYENRPNLLAESGCMVPTVENLAIPLIQWENPHFNSLYPDKPPSVLNAADGFTYISAFTLEYLRIFRAYMPDWNGNFNWTGALVTDKNPTFIAEPAQILLTFETSDEIYFVLREQPNSQMSKCEINVGSSIDPLSTVEKLKRLHQPYCLTSIARLVRVCKGDPGGLPHISSNRFATFAKADLICPATNENGGYFSYTHISTAYWDNNTQLLYATFTTEKSAPVGSALCIYSLNELKASFNGPLVRTNEKQNDLKSSPVPNSFSNICSRFNSRNMTEEEVTVGRRLSLRFPYRYLPVKPLHGHALLSQTGDNWVHLQAYNLPSLTNYYQGDEQIKTSIIWIGTTKHLIQFVVYTYNDVTSPTGEKYLTDNQYKATPIICKLKEILLGRQIEAIILQLPPDRLDLDANRQLEIHGDTIWNKMNLSKQIGDASYLHIMTNKQLFRLPLTRCSEYQTFDDCLNSKDPHCGWNWSEGRCSSGYLFESTVQINRLNTFSPSIDHRQRSNHQCPTKSFTFDKDKENSWTKWYDCNWITSHQIGDPVPIAIHDQQSDDVNENVGDKISTKLLGSCLCRLCISQVHCVLGIQQVKNCTRFDQNWLPWSIWSDCDPTTNIQIRKRQCRSNAVCSGSSIERRSCLDDDSWFKKSNVIPKSASYYKSRINYTTQAEGYTLTHLILVVICGLLTGSLITVILFWSCRCHRWSYDEDDIAKLTNKNHIKTISTHCKSRLPYESQQTCLTTTSEPLSKHSWSLIDEKEPIWCNKSDIIAQASTDTRYEYLPPTHITPANTRFNRSVSRKPTKIRHLSTPYHDISTSVYLLSNTPSPTSVTSNPSTTSTLLKDKFTFDSFAEQNSNVLGDCKTNLINITPDNRNDNNNENLGNLYLTGYFYAPIEPLHNQTITPTKTSLPTTRINVELPEHHDYQTRQTPTISSHYNQINTGFIIPKSILVQPALSSFRENEHLNNSIINNTMITTKCIDGETFTITENPTQLS
ncbi:putative plexin [Schistosoma mansoni]|uniref:putative plexin n=1 Tax=Schistosoma mansoni TaxID=6183 RepID=UPI00022DC47C|nr:putative plexin [Schistosoma mansoni]|eukprot:XP_018648687.1 putative plexin [Schistosoma mansoni]